jgi:hypothetical protein
MFWRKFKLDWSYAVGELLIVVIGVLIALAIDQWNDDRLDRVEEVDAIARILVDIQMDLQDFDFRLKAVEAKEDSLLRVKTYLVDGTPNDPAAFLRDIIGGADFGWNQGLARRSTYDNLLESGKLGIIANASVRSLISDYYRYYQDSHNRIDERETDYPALSYRLVPRRISYSQNEGIVWEREVESGLSDMQLSELVVLVQGSLIREHVVAELNLARFIRGTELDLKGRALTLISQLKEYQTSIQ